MPAALPTLLKNQALLLRKEGVSLQAISHTTGVAHGTLKAWFRNPEKSKRVNLRCAARAKTLRKEGLTQDRWIYEDSRRSDRKHTRENDLDRDFIREAIRDGCSYCGETEIRMTLDRIDNDLGHLKSNVVPACIRCNFTRKDMPHEAWSIVAKGMREAREAKAFNGWTGRVR